MIGRRSKNRLVSLGVAAMLALAFVPLIAGPASAAPAAASDASGGAGAWAYGGENSSSGNFTFGSLSGSWNVTFGIDVVFNETNTSATTTELTLTRTVVLEVDASIHSANYSLTYHLKGTEDDSAYANLTTTATTTVQNGSSVPALGILNASAHATSSLAESMVLIPHTDSVIAYYLNATGSANAQTKFAPALGLVPLNLTGVSSWTSASTETANASWMVSWSWSAHGLNRSGTGSASRGGGLNFSGAVSLVGHAGGDDSDFSDHQARTAVDVGLSGGMELWDGFVLLPVGFDFFSGGPHDFDAHAVGNATISSESLYLTTGGVVSARSLSAARASFGASSSYFAPVALGGSPAASPAPAVYGSPGTTVIAQPESPSQAQNQARCLQYGCSTSGGLPVGLVAVGALAVGAVALGVVLMARRRNRGGQGPAVSPSGTASPIAPWQSATPQPPTPPSGSSDAPMQGPGGTSVQ